jgi:membrane fusion protein, multidrug efflux system
MKPAGCRRQHFPPSRERTTRRKPFLLSAVSCLAAAGLLFSSCSRRPAGGVPSGRGVAAVPVLVERAAGRDVPVEIHAIGTVQAHSLVLIRSQITGPITEVHFREGQEVRAGDPLFTIDPRPFEAALNLAEANQKRDEAQLISARLEFERTSNLFAARIDSQQDYDTAQAAYQAQAAVVVADNASVSSAQVSLGYTRIVSPIDGRTGNLTVKKGNVVKAPDDVLVSLTEVHPIYVAFAVPEQQLPAIRRQARQAALPVEVVVPDDPDHPARGELTFIDNTVDTNTGTILLKGTFANPDDVLWPGQFVHVSLTLSNLVDATVVPSQAVQTGQNGEFIFVVQPDQTVEARPVVTGIAYDGQTVIASGIAPGETVVTDGQLRLVPGTKVEVKTQELSGASTNAPSGSP